MRPRLPTLAATALLLGAAAALADRAKLSEVVPDAELLMEDGARVKLSAHEGKAVVLLFYGTWSRRSAPALKELDALRKRRAKQALVVVGVARDAKPQAARDFRKEHELGFDQAADPKAELYLAFAEKGLPWTVVIDGERKLRHSAAGFSEEDLDTVLDELLGKVPAEPAATDAEGTPGGERPAGREGAAGDGARKPD